MTRQAFEKFRAGFEPARYHRYVDRIAAAVGHHYTFSTTPLFLPRRRLEELFETVRSVVRLLRSPAYQRQAAGEPWFLPWHPLAPRDYFGCVDFHLSGEEARIIEVNWNPPGRFGLLELMEESFLAAFATPTLMRLNAGFERAVVAAATAGDPSRRVAIAVNPTASSQELRPHYQYVESFFRRHGVDARVVFADAVRIGADGFPLWHGERYDTVFNLLIARTWQDHAELFAPFTRLYERRPEIFFPSPQGARLGDKRLLAALCGLDGDPCGLAPADLARLRRATLPAVRLSELGSPGEAAARFGGERNLVLKPFDDYRGNGVVVQPGLAELAEVFARARHRYIAQRYFPAEELLRLTPDGGCENHPFEVRVGFLDGEPATVRGSSCLNLDMTPAVVV
jgi:hypothetical protein